MKLSPALGAAALALTGTMALAAPAQADVHAQAVGRSDVCTHGVCGSGTFTWGAYSLSRGSLSVKDTGCDAQRVAIRLAVKHTDGTWEYGARRWNDSGCHGGYRAWYNLSWNDSKKIAGFRVIGYKFSSFTLRASYTGNYVDNPRT
ncbi:hypothetical protein ACIGO8_09285 [Streptomyces sp. NPDC053493]|uniref:hypothetical protein n=1 Tax=Streptomyces sp. NPDC053493 TaxID=3365705 RepID=UPI0037CED765